MKRQTSCEGGTESFGSLLKMAGLPRNGPGMLGLFLSGWSYDVVYQTSRSPEGKASRPALAESALETAAYRPAGKPPRTGRHPQPLQRPDRQTRRCLLTLRQSQPRPQETPFLRCKQCGNDEKTARNHTAANREKDTIAYQEEKP
jgi:hypothetical protein